MNAIVTSDRGRDQRHWPVLCLLALLSAVAVGAQQARDVVTDRLAVTAVEIPVRVLRKGQPVRGLSAADFEVYDRGVGQRIIGFDLLDLTEPVPSVSPDNVRMTARRRAPRSRHLLVLIDLDFTDWQLLPRALRGARELVDSHLHPTDRLAIGVLSPSLGVQLLHPFTTDRRPSRLALEVIEAMIDRDPGAAGRALGELAAESRLQAEGVEDEEGWRKLARRWITSSALQVGESPPGGNQPGLTAGATGAQGRGPRIDELEIDPVRRQVTTSPSLYDERTLRRLLFMGESLRDLTRSLAGVPEPKQLWLLSAGVPSRFLDSRDHSTRVLARLELVIKACLESGWIVQAIDVRGVPSIDEPAFDGNALFHLAQHTGGELHENVHDVGRAAETILNRSRVTYILVIQPDVEADGSFHDLEVRLKQPDRAVRLEYRPGYRAPTPMGRLANLDDRRDVAQIILANREVQDFEVEMLAVPIPASGGRSRVPVLIEVPGEVLLANPFGDSAAVEVHAYGLDLQGGVEDLFIKRLDFDLRRSKKRFERGGLRLLGSLSLGVGSKEVRVLVRNLANDALSLASAPVDVASRLDRRLAVLPPLFVDSSRDWLSMRLDEPEGDLGAATSLIDTLGTIFYPQLEPKLPNNRSREVVLVLFFRGPTPRLQLRVLSPMGSEVEGAKIELTRRLFVNQESLALVASLNPRGLSPGGYRLEVSLEDPASGERVVSSSRFVVEEPS